MGRHSGSEVGERERERERGRGGGGQAREERASVTLSAFLSSPPEPHLSRLGHRLGLHLLNLGVALGTHRVETLRGLHGGVLLAVQRVRHVRQRQEVDVALVQLELHRARGHVRQLLDRRERRLARGVEVASVVHLVADVRGQLLEQRRAAPVKRALVDDLAGRAHQRHARRLVHAPRLRAEQPVLERVREADSVASGDLVRLEHALQRRDVLAVELRAATLHEPQGDLLHLVRGVLRPHAHQRLDDGHRRLKILQVLRLVRETGEVRVRRVALHRLLQRVRDAVLRKVLDHLHTAREVDQQVGVPPRGVHLHLGGHHVRVPLEPHLVVAPARGAVREHGHAPLLHLPHEAEHGDVAADAGALPVAAVVDGLGHDALEAGFGHLVLEVDDDRLLDAGRRHLRDDVVDVLLVRLSQVRREADHVHAGVDELVADRLRVETAGDAAADDVILRERRAAVERPSLSGHCEGCVVWVGEEQ
eukprot:Rhum_TRINITY_DN15060_c0_g1::Rhum_TRINITY_DN15060_c0_g1_i1::g.135701::m.135701